MNEFKGTKGKWEICEHSWSDTSILCDDKTIATISIYDEATEETQDELENEVSANFRLLCAAPDLLEACQSFMDSYSTNGHLLSFNVDIIRQAINKALGK